MNRRDFLKQVARWYAGGMAAVPVISLAPRLWAASEGQPPIFVSQGTDYESRVAAVIESMGGMARFVKKGDRVVVKPNIGWDRTPEQAADTHPQVVVALVKLALEAGAERVSVFDRPCNEERRCYHNSGIKPALEKIKNRRVDCRYMDERKFIPVDIKKGKAIQRWQFYKDALDADCYINAPIAKHHGLAGLTLGLKNVMGVIGGRRGRIHVNLAQKLADLNTIIRPDLTVIDATRILLRNGPQGGDLEDVKVLDKVLAATDPVAADALATTFFDKKPKDIESTVAAHAMGLGEINLNRCTVKNV